MSVLLQFLARPLLLIVPHDKLIVANVAHLGRSVNVIVNLSVGPTGAVELVYLQLIEDKVHLLAILEQGLGVRY